MISKGLLLEPESRQPLILPKQTVDAVLSRKISDLLCSQVNPAHQETTVAASVIVVSYNNLVFTRLCLESVLENTSGKDFELIVVDNGSMDGSMEYLRELSELNESVSIHLNDRNLGFARACNQGLELARGEVLVLLNNDTIVPPDWLTSLTRRLNGNRVGMVGPTTNRCGNEAEIESHYRTYGEMLEFAKQRASLHSGETQNLRMLAMFCVAFKRGTYLKIGPLDERFEIGLFEDEDYSMRLTEAGYSLVCAEDCFVHHFGQASIGKLASSGEYGELFHTNRRRFEKKWAMQWRPHARRPKFSYYEHVEKIKKIIDTKLPREATVLVVSKGDEDLVTIPSRRVWHFPQEQDGTYSGHHPANSVEAIHQLEKLRKEGGDFLVLPVSMYWWLQFYLEFAAHLAQHCPLVVEEQECLIYRLGKLEAHVDRATAMPYAEATGLDYLNRKLVTVVVPVLECGASLSNFIAQFFNCTQHSCRLLLIVNSKNDFEALSGLEFPANARNKVAVVMMIDGRDIVSTVNLGCSLAPGDVIVMRTSFDLYPGWLDEWSVLASNRERLATAGNEKALMLTRKALRKIGLLNAERFADWGPAVADFRDRATASGFANQSGRLTPDRDKSKRLEKRPCLLSIVHAGSGGSRFSLEDLLPNLSTVYRCLLLETGPDAWLLFEEKDGGLKPIREYRFSCSWRFDGCLGDERIGVLTDVCRNFQVALVNVHHLMGNGPEALEYLTREALPTVFSFHDHYAICPTAHLIDNHGDFCGGTCSDGAGSCSLNRKYFQRPVPGLKHGYVYEHRRRMASALRKCHAFTTPSSATKQAYLRAFDFLRSDEIHVIEHGRNMERVNACSEPRDGTPVRVVCIGSLNEAKGTKLIQKLLVLNQLQGRRFEFHFLGEQPPKMRAEHHGGICHGAFQRDELAGLLIEIAPSFSLLASICEETFSYTLSESWAAGIPVFASNRGALRERIKNHGGGWLLEVDDPNKFFSGMLQILDKPEDWRREMHNIRQIPLPSTAHEAEKLLQLFAQVRSTRKVQ